MSQETFFLQIGVGYPDITGWMIPASHFPPLQSPIFFKGVSGQCRSTTTGDWSQLSVVVSDCHLNPWAVILLTEPFNQPLEPWGGVGIAFDLSIKNITWQGIYVNRTQLVLLAFILASIQLKYSSLKIVYHHHFFSLELLGCWSQTTCHN